MRDVIHNYLAKMCSRHLYSTTPPPPKKKNIQYPRVLTVVRKILDKPETIITTINSIQTLFSI